MFSPQTVAQGAIRRARREIIPTVDPAIDADPVGWISKNFYIPETNAPITLYPCQIVPLREALSRDKAGNFTYSTVLWSAIKKSAKSSIAAAVGMWFAFRKPFSSVKVLGNDLKQAESRVYEYMRRAILLRPDWRDSIKVNNYKITLPNYSVIEAIPIDPTGEAGGNDDLVLYTELWGWKTGKQQMMWTESTLSPTKYGQSMRWCESYAGYKGESPVLEQLYTAGVEHGRVLNDEHEMYANNAARLFVLWNTKPNLPWQTPEYRAQEAATLAPKEFARIHENEWSEATAAFVPPEWWDACSGSLPALGQFQQMVVALDAAVTGDCFAMVGVTRHGEQSAARFCRIWTPPKGGKLDYGDDDDGQTDTPWAVLKQLVQSGRIAVVTYDEYQLHDFVTRVKRKMGVWCEKFDQGARRAVADKQLYDMVRDKRIIHDGHADLTLHIKQANQKAEGDKLRLVKRTDAQKIDAAVALSMANAEVLRLQL